MYYSSFYNVPIIVNDYTYMSNIVNHYGLGLTINLEDSDLPDTIYNYFVNLDRIEYKFSTEDFNKKVINENKHFKDTFETLIIKMMAAN